METFNDTLQNISFKNGIKANDIDNNFNVLDNRWKFHLLNTVGYGIIDGLEIKQTNTINKIIVTSGNYINKDGVVKHIKEQIIRIDPLNPMVIENKEYEVNKNGEIRLDNIPYDPYLQGYLSIDRLRFYTKNKPLIVKYLISNNEIEPINIIDNKVILSHEHLNTKVKVQYNYIYDRIDAIVIDDNNNIKVLKGVESASPSIADLNKYKSHIVLGFVRTKVGEKNTLDIIDKKTIKNVYTNKNNELFLQGINFQDIVSGIIFFEEPAQPIKEDTLWYDKSSNQLKVWQNNAWKDVNTIKTELIRKVSRWNLNNNPKDLQTYYFTDLNEASPYIVFLKDQVEIIIDNTPLMHDQFELIYKNDDPSTYQCLGFKLAAPLERPSYVESRLYLTAKEEPLNIVYRKYSAYTIENIITSIVDNFPNGIIDLNDDTYSVGECQLELYVDGKKLAPKIDFDELNVNGLSIGADDLGTLSNKLKIYNIKDIDKNSILTYRITKTIYAYDHINNLIDALTNKTESLYATTKELGCLINSTNENVSILLNSVSSTIDELQETINVVSDNYLTKKDKISIKNIADEVLHGLHKGKIELKDIPLNTTINNVPITSNDFCFVFYISNDYDEPHRNLIEGIDYTIQDNEDDLTSNIILAPQLINDNHHLYIKALKLFK